MWRQCVTNSVLLGVRNTPIGYPSFEFCSLETLLFRYAICFSGARIRLRYLRP
jgi:hypothetical protein